MKLVVAEKPSVGAAFAKALGVTERKDGYIEGTTTSYRGASVILWSLPVPMLTMNATRNGISTICL